MKYRDVPEGHTMLQVSIVDAVRDVALGDPISTVLFAMGVLLLGGSLGVFGLLSAGAALDFLTPS